MIVAGRGLPVDKHGAAAPFGVQRREPSYLLIQIDLHKFERVLNSNRTIRKRSPRAQLKRIYRKTSTHLSFKQWLRERVRIRGAA